MFFQGQLDFFNISSILITKYCKRIDHVIDQAPSVITEQSTRKNQAITAISQCP
jgi:hypothetical protein